MARRGGVWAVNRRTGRVNRWRRLWPINRTWYAWCDCGWCRTYLRRRDALRDLQKGH